MGLLDGGVAIVTGAASGIGRASAEAFAREGARAVVVADVDADGGEETVELVHKVGADALFVRCDVSQEADVEALVRSTMDRFGGIDYAHNNAGVAPRPALLVDVTQSDWEQLMGVHLKGVWLCMKYEIRAMLPLSKGAIVNTASTAGLAGAPMMSVYGAAKHGIIGLTKAAALENADAGIRVNVLCPGHTTTPMQQRARAAGIAARSALGLETGSAAPARAHGRMARSAEASEQAEAAVWLCSNRASYLTGATIAVDGGQTAQLGS